MPLNPFDAALAALPAEEEQPQGNPLTTPATARQGPPVEDTDNVFLQAQRQREQEQAGQTRAVVTEGLKTTTPEKRTEALSLAQEYHVAVDVVERNFDYYKALHFQDSSVFSQALQAAPKFADWLRREPWKAAATLDDVKRISEQERTLTYGAMLLRGVDNTRALIGRFTEAYGEAADNPAFTDVGGRLARGAEADAENLGYHTTLDDVLEDPSKWLQFGAELFGDNIPYMGVTAAGGIAGAEIGAGIGSVVPGIGTAIGATVGGFIGAFIPSLALSVGETQQSAKQLDPNARAGYAVWLGGSAVAAFDSILPGKIGGKLVEKVGWRAAEGILEQVAKQPVKPQFLIGTVKGGFSGMLTEGLTEAIQQGVGDFAASISADKDYDLFSSNSLKAIRDAAVGGAFLGGIMGGGEHVATFRSEQARYAAGQQQKLIFDALADGTANSELAKRDPVLYQEVIAAITKGGPLENVLIDTKVWREYWQSKNVSPEMIAGQLTGKATALVDAETHNEPLLIPTSSYAAHLAATEHHAFFAEEMRLREDLPSVREQREFAAGTAKAMGEMTAAMQAAATGTEPAEAAQSEMRQALVRVHLGDPQFHATVQRAGLDPVAVANVYAAGQEAVITILARRAGEDPLAVLSKYNFRLGRSAFNAALEAVRKAAQPQAAESVSAKGTPETGVPGAVSTPKEGETAAPSESVSSGGTLPTDPNAPPEVAPAEAAPADGSAAGAAASTVLYQKARAIPPVLPRGFEAIAQYMLPGERLATVKRASYMKSAMEVLRQIPNETTYRDAALAGQIKRGWYERAGAAIMQLFGPVDGLRFTALLAATSPQISVEKNLVNAVTIWRNWLAAGRPTDRESIERILDESVPKVTDKNGKPVIDPETGEESKGVLDSWIKNTVTALSTEDPNDIRLSGPKVNPFMLNLLGHVQQVTTDAWMVLFSGVLRAILKDPPTDIGHRVYGAMIRRVAARLTRETGETWTPAEVQETVWSWAKTLYELAEELGMSAKDVLKQGLLTDTAIAEAPDFATMFARDATVRELLEPTYGPLLKIFDDELAAAEAAPASGVGDRTRAPRPTGEAVPVTPALLRAAGRLDWVAAGREARSKAEGIIDPERKKKAPIYQSLLDQLGQNGGFTYSVLNDLSPVDGFTIGVYAGDSEEFDPATITGEDLAKYVLKKLALLTRKGHYLGAWIEEGRAILDVSVRVRDAADAQAVGFENDQIAYFDLVANNSVKVVYPEGHVHGPYWQGPGKAFAIEGPPGAGSHENPDAARLVAEREAATPAGRRRAKRGSDTGAVPAPDGAGADPGGRSRRPVPAVEATIPIGITLRQGPIDAGLQAAAAAPGDGGTGVPPTPAGPNGATEAVQVVAALYAREHGFEPTQYGYSSVVHIPRARDIAAAYEALAKDDSDNPIVRAAYEAYARETQAQWDWAIAHGVTFEAWRKDGQPYANSAEMVADVRDHNHLWFFTGGEDHPFMGERTRDETGLTLNDKFRAIHDYFGHAAGGYGFGARGEENAWRVHSQMFSVEARRAMTTETRGQNSWTNYGPQNYDAEGNYKDIPPADRPFAEQKVAVLPDAFVVDGESITLAQSPADRAPSRAWASSRLVRAITESKAQKAKGDQWWLIAKAMAGGINRDEALLAGLHQLDSKTTYSKQEVLDFLRLNNVKVEYVVLAGSSEAQIAARTRAIIERKVDEERDRLERQGVFSDTDMDYVQVEYVAPREGDPERWEVDGVDFDSEADAEFAAEEENDRRREWHEREFEREIRSNIDEEAAEAQAQRELYEDTGQMKPQFTEYQLDMARSAVPGSEREVFLTAPPAGEGQENWEDGHEQYEFVENPIVRLRFNTRRVVTTVGVRQADAGLQAAGVEAARTIDRIRAEARDAGPMGQPPIWSNAQVVAVRAAEVAVEAAVRDEMASRGRVEATGAQVLFIEEIQMPAEEEAAKMPRLFREHAYQLALKWAMHHAAEQGLDGVAMTTGQQQVDRYPQIRSVIKDIAWQPIRENPVYNSDAKAAIEAQGGTTSVKVRSPRGGEVNFVVNGRTGEIVSGTGTGRGLTQVIGRELATQVRADPTGTISGMNIPVGGEGLKELYDRVLPGQWKKLPLVKRGGATLSTIAIPREDRSRDINARTMSTQTALMFTPELKAALLAGDTTLFQREEGGEQEGDRGQIRMGPEVADIDLTPKADLSTMLHETGHFYLQVMSDLVAGLRTKDPATLTPQQQQLVKDFEQILKWLKAPSFAELTRAQHEQFADGFLVYLMRGKSPSAALRGPFDRFRAWLTKLYVSLDRLGVDLSPEVVEVFDRMVASDEAIEAARAEARMTPFFSTAAQAGMSPIAWQGYQKLLANAHENAKRDLADQILRDLRRVRSQWWKEKVKETEATVRGEVNRQPVFAALDFLQKGQRPDGTEAPNAQRIAKESIVEKYGEGALEGLPRPWVYQVDGGLDVDHAARMFGFSSGDQMLEALKNAPDREALIEAETGRRMKAVHGDMQTDGTLREQARIAVEENGYEEVLAAELAALAAFARKVRPVVAAAGRQERAEDQSAQRAARQAATAATMPAAQLAEIATARIAALTAQQIKPTMYWQAAQQAGLAATEAFATGNYEKAVVEKHKQRLSVALHRAAVAALKDVDVLQRYADRLASRAGQARLGKAGESYQSQVNNLLNKYEFSKVSNKGLANRASLMQWVADRAAEGRPADIPAEVMEAARQTNYRQVPISELRLLKETLRTIDRMASLKDKLMTAQKTRSFKAMVADLLASLQANNVIPGTRYMVTAAEERKRVIGGFFASHARIATLAQQLDGFKDGGPMWSLFVRPLNQAADTEQSRRVKDGKAFAAIIEKYYPGRQLSRFSTMVRIDEINASLSREAIIALALNWGNETSRSRVRSDETRKFSDHQIAAILGHMDQRDWQFVQATWDFVDTYWTEISDKHFRLNGIRPEKVEAVPVVTKFGTFKGGYYPLAYDERLSARASQVVSITESTMHLAGAYLASTTRRGHEKARLEKVSLPIKLELGILFNHIDQVVHDLTHHEALMDVTRVIRDKKVQSTVHAILGDLYFKQFTSAIEDIAAPQRRATHGIDKAIAFAKTGAQMAGLGLNLWTAMQQPLGIFNGAARVGPTWVARGVIRWLTSGKDTEGTLQWIHEVSPFMRNRSATQTQDILDLRHRFSEPGGWFDAAVRNITANKATKQNIADAFMWHISLAQRVADVPTWLGQFEKSKAQGKSDEDAVALADQAVKDAQGGGQTVDLASVQRAGPLLAPFMTFYSYGAVVYNQTYRAAGKTDFKSPLSITRFLGELSMIYFFPSLCAVLLSRLLRGSGDDDDDLYDVSGDVLKDMGSSALNSMVLVRELGGLLRSANRGYEGPAGARIIKDVFNLTRQVEQWEVDEDLFKALNNVGGVVLKYPSGQVQRTVDGFVALQEGETRNPLVLVFGAPQ